jgi:hypothetical protein
MFGTVRAVPRLGELYPGICLTTEEKARKNLSQGSWTTSSTMRCQLDIHILSLVEQTSAGDSDVYWANH